MSLRRLLVPTILSALILLQLIGCKPKASSLPTKAPPPITQTATPTLITGETPTPISLLQGRLAFSMLEGAKANIYTANLDGSGLTSLTDQEGMLGRPNWSPDGKLIAYSSKKGIFVMNADGSGARLVTGSGPLDFVADWSPDGRFLLVDTYRDVNEEIYAVTLDGSRWMDLTQHPADDVAPRWSPDGTRIAFASDRDSPDGKHVFQIYSLTIQGGEVTKLTDFPNGASWPAWSPDGSELAVSVINDALANSSDVYILQANGQVIRKLTAGMGLNIPTDWSPDGKWVLTNWTWGNNQKTTLEAVDGSGTQTISLPGQRQRWQPGENAPTVAALDLQIPSAASGINNATQPFALINGVLIDGTGADPVQDGVILIENGKIAAVGSRGTVSLPSGIQTIDLNGKAILPGFIDAHVHQAASAGNLSAWIRAGVTTVCDLGSANDPFIFAFRDATLTHPDYARIVAAGPIVTSRGGYPISVWGPGIALEVTSAEDARVKVGELLDSGADIIKIAVSNTLSGEEIKAITDLAHQRGTLVLAHVDSLEDLKLAVDSGVDIASHMIVEKVPDDLIAKMVQKGFYIIPTPAVMVAYNGAAKAQILDNMQRFAAAGGKLALGDDYGNTGIELGMPMQDMELMLQAGLTPMQVILAGTRYAAHACNQDLELGTLEAGKAADILVVQGNPLVDITAMLNVKMVIRNGLIVLDDK